MKTLMLAKVHFAQQAALLDEVFIRWESQGIEASVNRAFKVTTMYATARESTLMLLIDLVQQESLFAPKV